MQLVSVAPGCAFASESMAPPRSLSVSWTVPAANEFAAFVVSLENAENVAAPLTAPNAPRTSSVRRTFLATRSLDAARELEPDRLDPSCVAAPQAGGQRGSHPQLAGSARLDRTRTAIGSYVDDEQPIEIPAVGQGS